MKQENIALVVNVEAFFGLTEWVTGAPPTIGWWKTRVKGHPTRFQPQRRWWNGEQWSLYVCPGEDDEATAEAKDEPTMLNNEIEWCGLKHPHPDGYPYQLERSDRTKLHALKRR